jgi:iron complex transport system substrate-binding protein
MNKKIGGDKKKKMKTKKKLTALVEIALVLCSVFLVALPAIAAEQITQEVSTSEVTTASEDDYALEIYGNANEDDTIDMGDVVYTKLAIFGKKPKTELCDAKYDGRINVLDVIQTKLIILGKEKELTIIDDMKRIVTVKKPIERVIATWGGLLEMLRSIKLETDQIVGVSSVVRKYAGYADFFPEYLDKPTVGSGWTPDAEAILNLEPDVVFLEPKTRATVDAVADILELAGIAVLRVSGGTPCYGGKVVEDAEVFGYIFDKETEAEEFIDWYEGVVNSIKENVENIPEENKPKVYFECSRRYSSYGERWTHIAKTGGTNILPDAYGSVDPEAVAERNPDIIVVSSLGGTGYHLNAGDTAELEEIRDEIMSRPELRDVSAIKEDRVYVISQYILGAGAASASRTFVQDAYQAKWFHPELFEDLDPQAIHQEYLTRFQGLDYDLDKRGIFVYHPEEHPDGN